MAEFRPHEILAVLDAHDVRYVLIGGLAAVLHGAPHVTTDATHTATEHHQDQQVGP